MRDTGMRILIVEDHAKAQYALAHATARIGG